MLEVWDINKWYLAMVTMDFASTLKEGAALVSYSRFLCSVIWLNACCNMMNSFSKLAVVLK